MRSEECKKGDLINRFKELKRQSDVTQQYIYKIDKNVQAQNLVMDTIGSGVALYSESVKTVISKITDTNETIAVAMKDLSTEIETMRNAVSEISVNGEQQKMGDIHDEVKFIRSAISELISRPPSSSARQGSSAGSYAGVLMAGKAKPVCLIKPKKDGQNHETTKSDVKKLIDPTTVAVSGIYGVSRGGIAIVCDNEAALSGVSELAKSQLGNDYEVSIPPPMLPGLRLTGVSEKHEPDELKRMLISQNELRVRPEEIKVLTNRETRRGLNYVAVLEVPPSIFRELMRRDWAKIGWDNCRVTDAVDVRRCNICCSYSHVRAGCAEEGRLCLRCGGRHEARDCENNRLCCVNCKRTMERTGQRLSTNHRADDRLCPTYLKALRRLREKIDFQ